MDAQFPNIRILFIIVLIAIIYTVSAKEEIRLVAGNGRGDGISSGRVEVRRNSSLPWGTVAVYSSSFGNKEAELVCKILGYEYGQAKRNAYYGRGTVNVQITQLTCGTSTNFFDCTISWVSGTRYNYKHYIDVGVNCFNSSVKILNDRNLQSYGNHNTGAIVLWDNGWGLVCDDGWNDEAAAVACRSLGFDDGTALCCSPFSYVYSNPSISRPYKFYKNFNCSGAVDDLFNCTYSVSAYTSCGIGHLASVICYNTTISNVNDTFGVRLVNTTGSFGSLEVRRYGYWGLVSGNSHFGWNESAANVSCRQMGYAGGVTYYKDDISSSKQMFWIQKLNCNGSENSLDECVTQWGRSYYEANVICYREKIKLSLVNGSRSYGRVQLSIDGVPGTICTNRYHGSDMASVVCRQLGFGQGTELVAGYFGAGDGPVYLESVNCVKDSVWDCRYDSDLKTPNSNCQTHSFDLAVKCHGQVKIEGGEHSNGIVYEQKTGYSWKIVCGNRFTNNAAKVLCRELSFTDGKVLPSGTFGAAPGHIRYSSLVFDCNGNETTLSQCTTSSTSCEGFYKKYAAVYCFDGSLNIERKLELKGNPSHPNTGLVSVSLDGFTGGICSDFFTENAVKIVCRQLGHTNGMAYRYPTTVNKYTIQELKCIGNETTILDCPVGSSSCLGSAHQAGVFCYNNTVPVVRFINGGSGKVEVVDGLDVGGVCLTSNSGSQSTTQARVICRQMNFEAGEFFNNDQEETTPIFMNSVTCTGYERSIFECSNDGWRVNEEARCPSNNKALTCYNSARIRRSTSMGSFSSGYVEMLYAGLHWNPICPGLDDNAARVICRELRAPYFKVLSDNLFKSGRNIHGMKNIVCVGNETSILDCTFTKQYCYGTSSLFCSKTSKLDDFEIHSSTSPEKGSFYSKITIEMYGLTGTICSEGWTDTAAKVFCKSQGYLYGVSVGSLSSPSIRTLAKDFRCTGEESRLQDCSYSISNLTSCQSSMMLANALCSDEPGGFSIRLKPSNESRNLGQVEVGYHGQWGPVCKQAYTNRYLAITACRQLGYVNGEDISESSYGITLPMLKIFGSSGCGIETTEIWKCKLSDFNLTYPCGRYNKDLFVKCLTSVDLEPGHAVGVAKFTVNRRNGAICRDGFDENAAKVACGQLGYSYHYILDYQPFNPPNLIIAYNNFRCFGSETSLEMCRYDTQYCRSNRAVQLMCSNYPSYSGYNLKIKSSSYGEVIVNHFNINGGICSNKWSNDDAKVVCREVLGSEYTGGFAYKRIKNEVEMSQLGIKWLTNLNCTGNESAISQCHHSPWGDIHNCSTDTVSAVYCLSRSASNVRIRLEGGDSKSGRIGVSAAGVWGTVCGKDFTDREASVVCRMLNFKGGYVTVNAFGRGSGPIHISQMKCTGDEQSVLDCGLKISESRSGCYHSVDAAVRCYNYVRMTGSTSTYINYGKLEIFIDEWKPVCDAGFTDLMAKMACKDMGYEMGSYVCCSSLGEGDSRSMVSLSRCRDIPGSLSDTCYVNTGCSSGKYVTVYCSKSSFSNSDIVTLTVSQNRVMVTVAEIQSAICAQNWTDKEANVSCKHAGYNGGIARFMSNEMLNPVLLGNIKCRGIETNLTECSRTQHSTGCSETLTNNQVIAGASCYSYGVVVCRELGYSNGFAMIGNIQRNSLAILDRVNCTGEESNIVECSYSKPFIPVCHNQIGVKCFNRSRTTGFILSPGRFRSNYIGSLAVIHENVRGYICLDSWDDVDATVACKQFGFTIGKALRLRSPGMRPYLLSNVNCNGSESRLDECDYDIGDITHCSSDKVAGTACSSQTGIFSGLLGENGIGLVQISIDGTWSVFCNSIGNEEAYNVFCKSIGYTSGHYGSRVEGQGYNITGPVYNTRFICNGHEADITDCTHSSWSTSYRCAYYASVHCLNDVRLHEDGQHTTRTSSGPVEIYYQDQWYLVCDNGFDDAAAERVCSDLGFADGKAIHGSTFGWDYEPRLEVSNMTLNCNGSETSASGCLSISSCRSGQYASVVCFNETDIDDEYLESDYVFSIERQSNVFNSSGTVGVSIFGVQGKICADDWDDEDAVVYCRSQGYSAGIAYKNHPKFDKDQPFWIGKFECAGTESDLNQCIHKDRLTMEKCESNSGASVVCHNGDFDVSFRFVNRTVDKRTSSQIYLTIDGVVGGLCQDLIDSKAANVICRQLGFDGGWKKRYQNISGPINWKIDFKCSDKAKNLLDCSHSGFHQTIISHPCEPTFVECFNSVYLSNGGAVWIYDGSKEIWSAVCDDIFGDVEASVVCKGVSSRYIRGIPILGSITGIIDDVANSTRRCSGTETLYTDCPIVSSVCKSDRYASVQCFETKPNTTTLTISLDSAYRSTLSGYLKVILPSGVEGMVCSEGFGKNEATVACRQLGFFGGVPYLPFGNLKKKPIVMADVSCSGDENTLADCQYNITSSKYICNYYSKRAGVLCYNSSGVNYRLTGGDRPGEGYVQMQYEGEWGNICTNRYSSLSNSISKVLCREFGYRDGIAVFGQSSIVSATSPTWFSYLICNGDESTPTNCLSLGFNRSSKCDFTLQLKCYNQSLEISDLRLLGGDNYGRVEVYMQGPNEWGTICGYYFSDVEAGVICRQLGYRTGKAVQMGGLGIGQGPIWLTYLKCNGTESKLTDCKHSDYTLPLCNHANDAGVICSGKSLETSTIPTTTIGPRNSTTTTTSEHATSTTTPKTTNIATATTNEPTTSTTTTTTTTIATTTTSEPTTSTTTTIATTTTSEPSTSTTTTIATTATSEPTTSASTPISTAILTTTANEPTASALTPISTTIGTTTDSEPTTSALTPISTTIATSASTPISTAIATTTDSEPTASAITPISTTIATSTDSDPTTRTTPKSSTTTSTTTASSTSTTVTVFTTTFQQAITSTTIDPNKDTGKPSITPGQPEKTTLGEKENSDSQSLLTDKEVTMTIGSVLGGVIAILIVIVILIQRKKRHGGYMLSDDLSDLSSTKMSEF
ncbi:hypothetical protein LOTGIDRAFT_233072 [Lottia gigantea]|uniref:SRCR domain-containing protein n=1 Tax=Lottia gigantea TaxID=225164 RepID=V4ABZ9_LOTGI|nr:hypothetical protein LOTGIDRAFT_233072 [Lottia gigantea]ESO92625.1 hypothetical protein LOTGIDRAFT_233072 [Lottia gigantea]